MKSVFLRLSFASFLYLTGFSLSSADDLSFNRDIKPLLSENCFACHGPDKEQVAGGFRLDQRESAVGEADSGGFPIIPGNASDSEIVKRLMSDDPDLRMPPPESGKELKEADIALIGQWIDEGAEYANHWAFVPPVRSDVPQRNVIVNASTSIAIVSEPINPIDDFIFDRLQREGLSPSPPAAPETLLRRVTLDLTGLPPTPKELHAFLADTSPNAYERVVDRLLMSPHYGERMALPWLDNARFADSNGYQSDGSREMWAWRDWVISAYNRNLPFDQFTVEQLAGDMLPDATQEQVIATGFNRNHRLNGEGGRIEEEWFVETVIDRVETTGLTWLGLTFNCCRCHDHKYDPISQREFYQMFAYFNAVEESGVLAPNGKNGDNTPPVLELPTAEQTDELAKLKSDISSAEQRLIHAKRALPQAIAKWEAALQSEQNQGERETPDSWTSLESVEVRSLGGANFTRLEDETFLASGSNPSKDTYEFTATPTEGPLTALLITVFPDASLPNESLGRSSNGNFVLTRVEGTLEATSLAKPIQLVIPRLEADFAQEDWPADSIQRKRKPNDRVEKQPKKGWAPAGFAPENRVARRLLLALDKAIDVPADGKLTLLLKHESQHAQHNIGRFQVLASSRPAETLTLTKRGMPNDIEQILTISPNDREPKQRKKLEEYFVANQPNEVSKAQKAVDDAKMARNEFDKTIPSTMVMKEGKQRDAFILQRGEYDKPLDKVERKLPAVLPPLPEGAPNNRLGLAKWIVDRSNPLTARVWVNRQWELFFGVGLVKTSENFGSQAEFPINPELLDWLAVEFMSPTVMPAVAGTPAQPWDMKAFHKMLVLSAAYRQASHVTPELLERDPENRLLARGPRFRLAGEFIRDAALASSGLLVPTVGGPSSRPYMPAGVWDETSKYGNLRNYEHDKGDGLYRRSIYTIWKRTAAPPTMLLFDAPNREVCTIKRSRTNTPLQALSLMNEITFVESSRALALRMIEEGGESPEARIAYAFELAIARQPTATEMEVIREGLLSDLNAFASDPDSAKKLVAVGDSNRGQDIEPASLAAYTLTANVILNLDEFVTRE